MASASTVAGTCPWDARLTSPCTASTPSSSFPHCSLSTRCPAASSLCSLPDGFPPPDLSGGDGGGARPSPEGVEQCGRTWPSTARGPTSQSLRPGTSLPPLREAKRVVLVRHGQSTWNTEGRIQGSSDLSVLTPKGEFQAETSRQMLLSDSFDACITSPFARSCRTAEIIWQGRDDDLIPDSDLREIDLYSFQGLLKHEGKERYGVLYRQWQKNAANLSIDGHYVICCCCI